jgi:hypothetical protein
MNTEALLLWVVIKWVWLDANLSLTLSSLVLYSHIRLLWLLTLNTTTSVKVARDLNPLDKVYAPSIGVYVC